MTLARKSKLRGKRDPYHPLAAHFVGRWSRDFLVQAKWNPNRTSWTFCGAAATTRRWLGYGGVATIRRRRRRTRAIPGTGRRPGNCNWTKTSSRQSGSRVSGDVSPSRPERETSGRPPHCNGPERTVIQKKKKKSPIILYWRVSFFPYPLLAARPPLNYLLLVGTA